MRDVNAGWLLRYAHMNGASFFFIVTYIHIFRGLYYGSYKAPRELVWMLGLVIYLLMMATAFMGYVLPWGQMSYWGAQVITGFFSAFPLVGEPIRVWLLGGYAPDQAALTRFFSLHYLLPFVIAGGGDPAHLGAAHPGLGQPDRRRREGREATRCRSTRSTRRRTAGSPARSCWSTRWSPISRRTISATRTITFRPTRWRRRRTSFPNGISGRSTRSCAPSPSTSSCRPSCGACWRCSARSCCCSSCRGSTSRRSARAATGRCSSASSGCWSSTSLILGYVGGAPVNAALRRARPGRGGLLFRAFPRSSCRWSRRSRRRCRCRTRSRDRVLHGEAAEARSGGARSRGAARRRRPVKGTGRHMRFILGFIGAVFAGVLLISLFSDVATYFSSPPAPTRRGRIPPASRRSCSSPATARSASSTSQQLQRGFQVYTEVCSACHSLSLVVVPRPQGLGYNEAEIKKIAVRLEDRGPVDQPGHRRGGDPQGAAVRHFPGAVRQRDRGARGQQQCASARSVADHQGARGRRGLRLFAADRLPEPAGRAAGKKFPRREDAAEPALQPLFREPQHRDAAAADQRRAGDLCGRHQADRRPDGEGRRGIPGVDGRAEPREPPCRWACGRRSSCCSRPSSAIFAYRQIWDEAKRAVRVTGALDPENQAKTPPRQGQAGRRWLTRSSID